MGVELNRGAALLICGPGSVLLLTACALYRIAERRPNFLSFATAVLGVTLSFAIVAVVPYDVWHALNSQSEPEQEAGEVEEPAHAILRRSWAIIYWTTTLLCYLFCPVLMEFEASGDFTAAARLRTSLRRNVVFYIIYAAVSGALLIWLLVSGEVKGSLESWCIAASNAWGMLVLTVLMGFGLVGVPRHLWRLADPKEQLRRLYVAAVAKDELRLSRLFELQDAIDQARSKIEEQDSWDYDGAADAIRYAKQQAFQTLQKTTEHCEDVYRELTHGRVVGLPPISATSCGTGGCSVDSGSTRTSGASCDDVEDGRELRSSPHRSSSASSSSRGDPVVRLRRLAQLHGTLKVAALEARRAVARWDSHCRRCIFFEDLEAKQYKAAAELLSIRPSTGVFSGGCAHARSVCCYLWQRMLGFWLSTLRARALRLLSYLCGALSAVIVVGQMTMFDERHSYSFSLLAWILCEDRGVWLTQFLCLVPLTYMTYTAYFSIFRLRIPGWYGLYANHNTDMGSLLWCSSILARLAGPLCYHFLLLARVRGTTFQQFMGKMNVVPVLGESFNDVFPCIVVVLCLMNLLNVYSRIVRCLSFGAVDFEFAPGGEAEDPQAEGRQLIERERRRRAEERESNMEMPARARLAVPLAAPAG